METGLVGDIKGRGKVRIGVGNWYSLFKSCAFDGPLGRFMTLFVDSFWGWSGRELSTMGSSRSGVVSVALIEAPTAWSSCADNKTSLMVSSGIELVSAMIESNRLMHKLYHVYWKITTMCVSIWRVWDCEEVCDRSRMNVLRYRCSLLKENWANIEKEISLLGF